MSILVPSTSFTDEDFDILLETLGLSGFSQGALTKWHRSAPKMSSSQLETLVGGDCPERIVARSYLDGMVVAATATT